MRTVSLGQRLRYLVGLLGLLLPLFLYAETPAPRVAFEPDELRQKAQDCEKRGAWLEASRYFEELFRHERKQPQWREGYLRCLRQVYLARRHGDPGYRAAVSKLTTSQALDLYEQVLEAVAATYVDRPRTELTQLVRQGLAELRLALSQDNFVREHFATAPAGAVEAFKGHLDSWTVRQIGSRTEAREQVLAVARSASQAKLAPRLGPLVTLVALEFAAGACNGLDEYTLFLSPGHYSDVQASLRGRFVGVGIDVGKVEQHLEITRVYPRSPAAEAGLLPRDRIVRIDRQAVDNLSSESAADKLRGEAGSALDLEVLTPGQIMPHGVRLLRRQVVSPSVEHEVLMDDPETGPIGYLRIVSFQENTVQEVKEALAELQTMGVRALLLDLRGNGGGAFRVAVQVAELFLGEGIIVYTQSRLKEYNRPFRADLRNPCVLPLVVLVDGNTASSAEVVAGALQENGRALLVGQPTYGKGSIQCILPLERVPAGIRVTVASFSSPLKNPYSGRGVLPDLVVEQEGEPAFAVARQEARRLAAATMVR